MICQGNIAKFCKFYVEMFKSCSVTINPAFMPCSPRTCEMLFTDRFPNENSAVQTDDRNE